MLHRLWGFCILRGWPISYCEPFLTFLDIIRYSFLCFIFPWILQCDHIFAANLDMLKLYTKDPKYFPWLVVGSATILCLIFWRVSWPYYLPTMERTKMLDHFWIHWNIIGFILAGHGIEKSDTSSWHGLCLNSIKYHTFMADRAYSTWLLSQLNVTIIAHHQWVFRQIALSYLRQTIPHCTVNCRHEDGYRNSIWK